MLHARVGGVVMAGARGAPALSAMGAALLLVREAMGAAEVTARVLSSSDEKPASINCGIQGAGAAGSSCLPMGPG